MWDISTGWLPTSLLSPLPHISDTNSFPSEIRLLDSYMSASGFMISISNLKLDLCKFLSQTVNSKVSRCVLTRRRKWIHVKILGQRKYVNTRFIFRWSFTPEDDKCPI